MNRNLYPEAAEVCFDTDVMLIMNSACDIPGCHNGSGEAPSLTSYADVDSVLLSQVNQ